MKQVGKLTAVDVVAVVMVCALVVVLLVPICGHTRVIGKQIICMANLRGLSTGWILFAQDNDGVLARSNQGPDRWVDRPHQIDPATGARLYTNHNSTIEEKINGIKGGVLFPYTGQPAMYHCPSDKRYQLRVGSGGFGAYRTYAMPDSIGRSGSRTLSSPAGPITIGYVENYNEFASPGDKYIFVEENYTHSPATPPSAPPDRGYNGGVWSFWRGGNYESWWDPIVAWHDEGMNLGFADGHAEYRRWADQRTVWFANDRMDPRLGSSRNECAIQPGNPDQQYMSEHYPCKSVE